nr:Hypothetical protein similar to putative retroelement [Oryza sativa Japonica Group]AAP53492.2 hypothetical protein LOC_Os10g24380 [Oryza sativa Japonica Group]
MEVVKLMEQCNNIILHKLPEKKKDPRCPTITCSIGAQQFDQALCDLGANVSVMPKDVFDKLNFTVLAPTPMRLQLADSSVRYPAGIAEDVPVKIRDFFIPVDFVVLDMDTGKETLLILGRPFLSTAGANIDVGMGSQNQVPAKPTEYSSGQSGATQDGQPGEVHAEFPGEGNNDAQEPLMEDAGTTTYTGQEARAVGSEEAVFHTKAKEGVEGKAKVARSITSGDGMRRRLSRLFKGSSSSSRRHDESSTHSSADVSIEDAKAPRRLLNDTDLDLVSDREKQAYYMLSDQEYAHTREYSPELLKKIGMDVEFRAIWKAVGWQRFAMVDEPSSRLLTLQFLCTLKEIEDGISFRFFREEFTLTWKGLSTLLGFHDSCKNYLQKGISGFKKNMFWEDTSGAPICKKPRMNNIHNPTLRLMHKWIAMTLFPRGDLRPIRRDELITMYALTIEESRAGEAYRETRNMTRNERENSSSSTLVQMYEEGWEPTGDAPGWTQTPRHSIGVSNWASASEDRWHAPHDIHWGDNQPSNSSCVPPTLSEWRSSSFLWDLGEITRRMDTLDM